MRDPVIGQGVTVQRKDLRVLVDCDPMALSKVESDGSIQVGDGWEAEAFDYENNGYKGAIAAAEVVFETEGMKPAMIVGGDLLAKHRQDAKDVASR